MHENTSKKFNKLAMILLVLFVISLVASQSSSVWSIFVGSGIHYDNLIIQTKIFHTVVFLFQTILHIGVSIWLFLECKKTNSNQWIWAFLGLFSGVFGLILWFLFQIHEKMEKQKITP